MAAKKKLWNLTVFFPGKYDGGAVVERFTNVTIDEPIDGSSLVFTGDYAEGTSSGKRHARVINNVPYVLDEME